jgi:hypothetical protein
MKRKIGKTLQSRIIAVPISFAEQIVQLLVLGANFGLPDQCVDNDALGFNIRELT